MQCGFIDLSELMNGSYMVTDSPSASNAKGFNRGTVYTEDGKLVASAIQEGLMRQIKTKKA